MCAGLNLSVVKLSVHEISQQQRSEVGIGPQNTKQSKLGTGNVAGQ